jgi:hypothetical protein
VSEEQIQGGENERDPAPVHREVMPVQGDVWQHRGFDFQVDSVADGEVYFVRFKVGSDLPGRPMRIDLQDWQEAMTGATKVRSA